jgi:RNA polymerase-binding transcription factor DksA
VTSQGTCPDGKNSSCYSADVAVSLALGDLREVLGELHVLILHLSAGLIDADHGSVRERRTVDAPLRRPKRSASLEHVNEADLNQHRVLDSSFGICASCGCWISLARLKGHPDAQYCEECDITTQKSP